jgi:hypothetical protein
MEERNVDKFYKVDHEVDFSLTPEQTQKLIRSKFERYNLLDELAERERLALGLA